MRCSGIAVTQLTPKAGSVQETQQEHGGKSASVESIFHLVLISCQPWDWHFLPWSATVQE